MGLQLRHKTPKRRVKAKLPNGRAEAVGPNEICAMDFVPDQLATGRKLWVLTVADRLSVGKNSFPKPQGCVASHRRSRLIMTDNF